MEPGFEPTSKNIGSDKLYTTYIQYLTYLLFSVLLCDTPNYENILSDVSLMNIWCTKFNIMFRTGFKPFSRCSKYNFFMRKKINSNLLLFAMTNSFSSQKMRDRKISRLMLNNWSSSKRTWVQFNKSNPSIVFYQGSVKNSDTHDSNFIKIHQQYSGSTFLLLLFL